MYYAFNNFEYHALRYNFAPFLERCESLRAWGVTDLGEVSIKMGEMDLAEWDRFAVRCSEGTWDIVKWFALSDQTVRFRLDNTGNFAPLNGAIALAAECFEKGVEDETELRTAFDEWQQMLDLTCRCKASEYRERRRWYACSRYSPDECESTECHELFESYFGLPIEH
jgi:hypothetical protein